MINRLLRSTTVAAIALSAAPSTAAVTFGLVDVDVLASVTVDGAETSQNPFGFGTAAGVDRAASVSVTFADGVDPMTARSSASLVLNGAAAGTATFSQAISQTGGPLNPRRQGKTFGSIVYGFSLSDPALFQVSYAVSAKGTTEDNTPFGGSYVIYDSNNGGLKAIDFLFDGAAGSTSTQLAAGDYTLRFEDYNVNRIAPGSGQPLSYDATFRFAIGAVPEPATWATMIGGIGAAGVTLRRRRRGFALAA